LFVFTHPQEAAALKAKGKHSRDVTYEFAQNEIAKNSGLQFEDGRWRRVNTLVANNKLLTQVAFLL